MRNFQTVNILFGIYLISIYKTFYFIVVELWATFINLTLDYIEGFLISFGYRFENESIFNSFFKFFIFFIIENSKLKRKN